MHHPTQVFSWHTIKDILPTLPRPRDEAERLRSDTHSSFFQRKLHIASGDGSAEKICCLRLTRKRH